VLNDKYLATVQRSLMSAPSGSSSPRRTGLLNNLPVDRK